MNSIKSLLDTAIIKLQSDSYLGLLIVIAPLLNFLTGINIDLYTPSLPDIAHFYDASIITAKNTITATMIGFASGCIIFGTLIDIFGRRRIILFGLTTYLIASLLALKCTTIDQLMLVRIVQGMMASITSIGGRAIVMDNFTGHRLNVGLLYTSLAYSLGPIVAPFIGGILQFHFGWKANFLAYAFFAISLLIIFALYVKESLSNRQPFSLKNTLSNYITVIQHKTFMAGVFVIAMCQIVFMIYPTVGAFIIEDILHRTAITYGNTALIISCGYLLGTLINRMLIKNWHLQHLTSFGFVLLFLGLILQITFAMRNELSLSTIVIPLTLMGFGNGFVFGNTLGRCLQLFPHNVGVALGLLSCLLTAIAALGVFIISHIAINSLTNLAIIFSVVLITQLIIFSTVFTRGMRTIP